MLRLSRLSPTPVYSFTRRKSVQSDRTPSFILLIPDYRITASHNPRDARHISHAGRHLDNRFVWPMCYPVRFYSVSLRKYPWFVSTTSTSPKMAICYDAYQIGLNRIRHVISALQADRTFFVFLHIRCTCWCFNSSCYFSGEQCESLE